MKKKRRAAADGNLAQRARQAMKKRRNEKQKKHNPSWTLRIVAVTVMTALLVLTLFSTSESWTRWIGSFDKELDLPSIEFLQSTVIRIGSIIVQTPGWIASFGMLLVRCIAGWCWRNLVPSPSLVLVMAHKFLYIFHVLMGIIIVDKYHIGRIPAFLLHGVVLGLPITVPVVAFFWGNGWDHLKILILGPFLIGSTQWLFAYVTNAYLNYQERERAREQQVQWQTHVEIERQTHAQRQNALVQRALAREVMRTSRPIPQDSLCSVCHDKASMACGRCEHGRLCSECSYLWVKHRPADLRWPCCRIPRTIETLSDKERSCVEATRQQGQQPRQFPLAIGEQPCPFCGIAIEKNGGCHLMHCEHCGCSFCWICNTITNEYGHIC